MYWIDELELASRAAAELFGTSGSVAIQVELANVTALSGAPPCPSFHNCSHAHVISAGALTSTVKDCGAAFTTNPPTVTPEAVAVSTYVLLWFISYV